MSCSLAHTLLPGFVLSGNDAQGGPRGGWGGGLGFHSTSSVLPDSRCQSRSSQVRVSISLARLVISNDADRSLNFLAHGLFDPDSWLHHFDRQVRVRRKQKQLVRAASLSSTSNSSSFLSDREIDLQILVEMDGSLDINSGFSKADRQAKKKQTSSQKDVLPSWLNYDPGAGEPLVLHLPERDVILPSPFPAQRRVGEAELERDRSYESSCEAALPLLKHIAEMSYRGRDLARAALKAYMKGDSWTALDLFDEAANLGLQSAQVC